MKFDVDYTDLDTKLSEPTVFKYADVKDRLVKVAFDIVRFRKSEEIDGLWQIQQTDDGEVIVATYEDVVSSEVSKQSSVKEWDARSNKAGTNITVFYNGSPVAKVATVNYGIPAEDAGMVCSYLPEKLANDNNFRKSLFTELSNDERQELFEKFPELSE